MRIKILLLFLLLSCTKDLILEDKTQIIQNEDYFTALAEGYKELSNREKQEFDWFDTEYFAQKGIDAYNKKPIIPANPDSRIIQDQLALSELFSAYNSLIKLLISQELDIKYKFPLRAARLQILYDYWLEQAEENWQRAEINRFRDEFWASYESLVATAKLTKIKERQSILTKKYFTIYFPEKNSLLNTHALRELDNFKFRIANTTNNYSLVLENYSNLKQNEANKLLLTERTKKIKSQIFASGILRNKILKEENIFVNKPDKKQNFSEYIDRLEIYIIDKKI